MPQRRSASRRVLILSTDIGGIDRAVADALARQFRKSHPSGVDVRAVDFLETFMPSVNVLAKLAYQQADPLCPGFYGSLAALTTARPENLVVRELNDTAIGAITDLIDEFAPDAVISTSSLAGSAVAEVRGKAKFFSATVLTDFDAVDAWLHPSTDLYFVATRDMREDLVVHGVAWDRVVESGVPLPEPEADAATDSRERLGLADRFTVLLSDTGGTSIDTRAVAVRLLGAGVQVVVPPTTNTRLKRRLEVLAEREPQFHLLGQTAETNRMVGVSDILVGGAGGTAVRGAIAAGVPVIVCNPVPRQEIRNIDHIVNAGAGLLARDEDDVAEKVHYLSRHTERLEQMRQGTRTLSRSGASQTVCERVLSAVR